MAFIKSGEAYEFSGCNCKDKSFTFPDHIVAGIEGGPLLIYRKKHR